MSDNDNKCDVCKGGKTVAGNECPYCNGTGEWNQAGQAYVKNHICMCINWDRKFCPVCLKICHHTTSQNPKQLIGGGGGGISSSESYTEEKHNDKVVEIIA